ncbi:HNH endonuclease signature motif containing protein [Corynebacterium renale]|uniref:HNH endonuclease signature motif containing protein n=1 Tax=Corynebacterium renale TaxID=1724 RepID=UPI000E005EFC|nr:HNH endonuclease signature motif containing protein [Corynebacterium renale]STD03141.1 HNH endonuclease [Corynebacterium renale]
MQLTDLPRHIRRRDGVNPPAFFCRSDQTDKTAVLLEDARRIEFMALEHLMPKGHEPLRDVLKRLKAVTNFSEGRAKRIIIVGMAILYRLPRVLALQRQLHLLDAEHIGMLASVFEAADADTFDAIDHQLEKLLTPTMPRQAFPDYTALRKKLTTILVATNPHLKEEPTREELPPFDLDLPDEDDQDGDGIANLRAEFTKPDGLILDEAIRKIAARYSCPRQEAFHKLLFDNITVNLTLNIYQAQDIPDAPAWVSGIGWMTGALRDELLGKVTATRDLADYKEAVSNSYTPSAGIKAYLEGRDGTCGLPGCMTPAHRCQKDHRVEYAEGGPTSVNNMVDLCSSDHNHKTHGGLHYVLDPETGTTMWLHTDGTFEVGLATGPLSPQGKWEAMTIAQYRTERAARARHARRK